MLQVRASAGAARDLTALAPANQPTNQPPQFGGQASGTDEEERAAAYRKFGTEDFEVFDHIRVNGEKERSIMQH
jgi:glutathione peroxidase-family protein